MTKICILEIGARVLDTNSEEYTCLYQNWFESESETLKISSANSIADISRSFSSIAEEIPS